MKIDFEFTTQYGLFRDAIYLDDNQNLSNDELNALKDKRLNNWIYVIENPPINQPEVVEIDGRFYEKIQDGENLVLTPVEG